MNQKSDVGAKQAFCIELTRRGYFDAKVIAAPADISATLNGQRFFFEIKYTMSTGRYFGAATLTEWMAAIEDPDHFRFVIAYQSDNTWQFEEYTVEEFMAHSYVPPFKIFFNVTIGRKRAPADAPSKRIRLTEKRLTAMKNLFQLFRDEQS